MRIGRWGNGLQREKARAFLWPYWEAVNPKAEAFHQV